MWLRRLLISQQECRSIWNPHVINSDKACGGYYFWRLLSSFFLDPHLNKPGRYKTGHDVIALREKKRKGGLELTATQFILPWEVDSEKYNWQWERIGRVLSMEWQKYKSPTPLLPLPPPLPKTTNDDRSALANPIRHAIFLNLKGKSASNSKYQFHNRFYLL